MAKKVTTTVVEDNEFVETPPVAVGSEGGHPAGTETPPEEGEDPPAEGEEPFYQATGRTLDKPEDAMKYIAELEQEKLNRNEAPAAAATETTQQTRAEYLAELQFSDPVKYHEEMDSDLNTRLDQREHQKTSLKNFYDGFYRDNADLKGQDYLVKLVQRDKMSELQGLSPAQASKELAKHVRNAIPSRENGHVEEVSTKKTTVLESGVDTGVKPQAQKPTTFTEELLAMRKG